MSGALDAPEARSARSRGEDLLTVLAPLRLEARAVRRGLGEACVLHTGRGDAIARHAAGQLSRLDLPAVAVAGLCGALDASLEPGDVVVATEVRGPDGLRRCEAPEALRDALEHRGLRARLGPVRSVPHLVRGTERARLAADGSLAVDTESIWLAEAAGKRPLAVLRVVVDGPRHELLRPGILLRGPRALTQLRRAAPALAVWARHVTASQGPRVQAKRETAEPAAHRLGWEVG